MKKGKNIIGYNPETGEPIYEAPAQPVVEAPVEQPAEVPAAEAPVAQPAEVPAAEAPVAQPEAPVQPVEQPATPVAPIQPIKRSKKDIIGYNPETGEPIYKELAPGEKPKKSHKGLIIGIILALVLIAVAVVVLILVLGKKSGKSDEEYQTIIDDYGKSAERAISRYVDNEDELPTFNDIKKDIFYADYEIECDTIYINYDGTIYLAACSVDGKKIDKDITYGRKKEKPPVEDKITVYKIEYKNNTSYYIYDDVKNKNKVTADAKVYAEYNCENEGCYGYTYDSNVDDIVVNDGAIYVYNFKTKKKTELKDVDKDVKSVSLIVNDKKELLGLMIADEDKSDDTIYNAALYNYKKQKYVTDFIYNYYGSYLNKDYVTVSMTGGKQKVIDMDGEIVYEPENNGYISYYDGYYFERHGISSNTSPLKVLNANFKELITDIENYNAVVTSDGNLIVVECVTDENGYYALANKYYIYDNTGKRISESKEFDRVYLIVKDYAFVLIGNKVNFVNVKNNKEVEVFEMKDSYKVHTALSGWWNKEGKEDGLWFVVEDESVETGTEGRGLEYYYIPKTGEIDVVKVSAIGGYAKPVLYLYPEEETEVSVSFEHDNYLTTTYPKYKNNWTVKAYPNGDLYDKDGKYYYGLYWEEDGSSDVDFSEGFYVTKDNAIDFLEEKLTQIGLNARERNEFIMYWLPILEKNEKNLVYFELTEERNNFNRININPIPDSLLRLAIHVKKVDSKKDIKEQVLPHFERNGFVAVEWGGVIH